MKPDAQKCMRWMDGKGDKSTYTHTLACKEQNKNVNNNNNKMRSEQNSLHRSFEKCNE